MARVIIGVDEAGRGAAAGAGGGGGGGGGWGKGGATSVMAILRFPESRLSA